MTTYVYAVCDDDGNHIRTINAVSMQQAKEKIIEIYRDKWELDEEFANWSEFLDFMYEHDVYISQSVQDVETL